MPTVHRRSYRFPLDLVEAVGRRLAGDRLVPTRVWLQQQAERRTGCGDWGEGWQEPLALLMEDLAAHPPGFLGRLFTRSTQLQAATNRLRIRRALTGRSVEAPTPVFIVGLHRTGTTQLQRLLGALPGHRYVPAWALFDPALDRRAPVLRTRLALGVSRLIAPEMWATHPVHARGPEECWTLFMPTFRVFDYTLHYRVPRYTAWLDACDMRPAYREYRDTLGLLAAQFEGAFVMKGPAHLHALDALLAVFPDAPVIWTHRDPARCIPSFGSLSAVQHRTTYGRFDPDEIGQRLVERSEQAVRAAMRVEQDLPPGRILHLDLAELRSDPVAAVERLAGRLDRPFDAQRVRAALHAAPDLPPHRYSAAQWGLEAEALRERFADYIRRYDVVV